MLGGWGDNRGLVESNGSLPPGLCGHLWADCRGPGSAQEPFARFEYGTTFHELMILQYIMQLS